MPWNDPADPVAGTVITVAYAVANMLDPIRWLRRLTGNADPPGTGYVAASTSTSLTAWTKVGVDQMAAGAAVANLGYTPVNKAGDSAVGTLALSFGAQYRLLEGAGFPRYALKMGIGDVMELGNENNGLNIVAANVALRNAVYLTLLETSGFRRDMLRMNAANEIEAGNPNNALRLLGGGLTYNGQTVWHAGNDGAGSALDAGRFEGKTYAEAKADIIAGVPGASVEVPAGVIAMWLASMTAPAGWVVETTLYNLMPGGVNATQNGTFGALGSTGGAASHGHDLSNHAHDYNHSHAVNAHAHTADHAHGASSGNNSASGQSGGTGTNRADDPHTHPITVSSTSGLSTSSVGGATANLGTSPVNTGAPSTNATSGVSNLPPFKAVLYIRKT